MYNGNKVSKALRKHDVAALLRALGDDRLKDLTIAVKFLAAIKNSSTLVIQNEDAAEQVDRDDIIAKCWELFDEFPHAEIREKFRTHVDDAKIIEAIYREIFVTIRAMVPALFDALDLDPAQMREVVQQHVALTHKDKDVLRAADVFVRILLAVRAEKPLRESILVEAPDWISQAKIS